MKFNLTGRVLTRQKDLNMCGAGRRERPIQQACELEDLFFFLNWHIEILRNTRTERRISESAIQQFFTQSWINEVISTA